VAASLRAGTLELCRRRQCRASRSRARRSRPGVRAPGATPWSTAVAARTPRLLGDGDDGGQGGHDQLGLISAELARDEYGAMLQAAAITEVSDTPAWRVSRGGSSRAQKPRKRTEPDGET